ncbi:YfiR family protein [Xenorhabdus sp. Flor]|nr:YfiR family protein [Xenorhabdus sp. Flor]
MRLIEWIHCIVRRYVSKVFLRLLTIFCSTIVICNSIVTAMPDAKEKIKLNENVARVVSGIISYTHWPVTRSTLHLCLVAPSNYIDVLANINMPTDETKLQVEILNFNAEKLLEKCDIVYYGQIDPILQHQVISQKNGKPLLTIAEQNQHCEIGSAFCLNIDSTQTTFNLNLDILTRSGVRVDPNVLQLARKAE